MNSGAGGDLDGPMPDGARAWSAVSLTWLSLAAIVLETAGIPGTVPKAVRSVARPATLASLPPTPGINGVLMTAELSPISVTRPREDLPFLAWLGTMAGIAFKQAATAAVVGETYGMANSPPALSPVESINYQVSERAAVAAKVCPPLGAALNGSYGKGCASSGFTRAEAVAAAYLPVPIPPAPPPPPLSVGRSAC